MFINIYMDLKSRGGVHSFLDISCLLAAGAYFRSWLVFLRRCRDDDAASHFRKDCWINLGVPDITAFRDWCLCLRILSFDLAFSSCDNSGHLRGLASFRDEHRNVGLRAGDHSCFRRLVHVCYLAYSKDSFSFWSYTLTERSEAQQGTVRLLSSLPLWWYVLFSGHLHPGIHIYSRVKLDKAALEVTVPVPCDLASAFVHWDWYLDLSLSEKMSNSWELNEPRRACSQFI